MITLRQIVLTISGGFVGSVIAMAILYAIRGSF